MSSELAGNNNIIQKHSRRHLLGTSALSLTLAIGAAALGLVSTTGTSFAADWTGTVSNNWFVTGNWSNGAVPDASEFVYLHSTAPNPTVVDGADAEAAAVIVGVYAADAASLSVINGWTLTSGQALIGQLTGSSGTATVSGAGSQWLTLDALYVGRQGDWFADRFERRAGQRRCRIPGRCE